MNKNQWNYLVEILDKKTDEEIKALSWQYLHNIKTVYPAMGLPTESQERGLRLLRKYCDEKRPHASNLE